MITESTPYRLVRTCIACPAQWQGQNADGEWAYLRQRAGVVMIGFGPTVEAAIDACIFERGYRANIDDDVNFDWPEMLPHFRAALLMHGLGARYG